MFLRPDGSTDDQPGARADRRHRLDHARSATTPPCWPTPTVTCSWPRPTRPRPLPSDVADADGEPAALDPPAAGRRAPTTSSPRRTDGRLVALPLAGGESRPRSPSSPARRPSAPIVHGGCVFAVSTAPATFAQWCADRRRGVARGADVPLDGAGSELRLRLVNGWVWVNDVDSGAAWVTSPQQRLDRVEDWGNILSDLNDDSDDEQHRRRRRRGHHRGQPRRPERRDRAVRRDRRGRPEPPADRPRRRDPDPRRPADRRRRAGQRHRSRTATC